jgi:hypothetical protein
MLSMPPRLSKADLPRDPSRVLRGLRACRDVMIETSSSVRVGGPVYHAAAMVVAAIDAMAVLLSGQRYYFSAVGGGTTESERQAIAERDAVERGEKPWPTE